MGRSGGEAETEGWREDHNGRTGSMHDSEVSPRQTLAKARAQMLAQTTVEEKETEQGGEGEGSTEGGARSLLFVPTSSSSLYTSST